MPDKPHMALIGSGKHCNDRDFFRLSDYNINKKPDIAD
jgi:hypothetical protein